MSARIPVIERLAAPVSDSDFRGLAALLVDAVESGAAVSFLAPLTDEQAEEWWRRTISTARPNAVFLVARDPDGIVGTVQLHPAWAPNQPHRAEVSKLLVHRRRRRAGIGARLMDALEDAARLAGFSLLTLDAKRGEAAERLYRRLGWKSAGTIPAFAFDSDGAPHDAVIFYKRLDGAVPRPAVRQPEGWHTVTPRIVVTDAVSFIAFLERVFGGVGEVEEARPSQIRIGDSILMVTGTGARETFPAFLYVYVEDADSAFQRAIESGATAIEPVRDTPYGDRRGMVRDPWGNVWQIATAGPAA